MLSVDDGVKSVESGIEKLTEGKSRISIYHNLSINYILSLSEYRNKVRRIELDFGNNRFLEKTYQYIVFSKKVSTETVTLVNRIIREKRKSGELEKITAPYLK
jgi:polar amino acid transport system substrate-binding protein